MQVLATLGDTPTAAIAVAAIVLGLLFAARGPRGELRRASSGEPSEPGGPTEPAPAPISAPIGAPGVEPGFVGPEGTVVGHGPIVLGAHGPLSGGAVEPAPLPAPPAPAPEPEPTPELQPERQAEATPSPIPFKQGRIRLRPADEPPPGDEPPAD